MIKICFYFFFLSLRYLKTATFKGAIHVSRKTVNFMLKRICWSEENAVQFQVNRSRWITFRKTWIRKALVIQHVNEVFHRIFEQEEYNDKKRVELLFHLKHFIRKKIFTVLVQVKFNLNFLRLNNLILPNNP